MKKAIMKHGVGKQGCDKPGDTPSELVQGGSVQGGLKSSPGGTENHAKKISMVVTPKTPVQDNPNVTRDAFGDVVLKARCRAPPPRHEEHHSPRPEPRRKGPSDAEAEILREVKHLDSQVKKIRTDCREILQDLGARLSEEIRREVQKNPEGGVSSLAFGSFQRVGYDSGADDNALRSAGVANNEASWGKVGGLSMSRESTNRLPSNARRRPLQQAVDIIEIVSDLPAPEKPPVNQPEDSPPVMPFSVQDDTSAASMATRVKSDGARSALKSVNLPGSPDFADEAAGGNPAARQVNIKVSPECSPRSNPSLPPSDEPEDTGDSKTCIRSTLRAMATQSLEEVHNAKSKKRLSISREKARSDAKAKSSKRLCEMNIAEIIKTSFFDNLVGGVILLNAAVIGIQTDHNARVKSADVPLVFYVFEQFFAAWFSFELALRLWVHRCSFFRLGAEGWLWNYFDAVVVGAQLSEVFFELVARSVSVDTGNMRVLRVLRILRLVRILRVVRVLHLISELRAIVSSIVGSFRSLIWVVVLMLIMIYIVAVFFTQSITDHLVEKDIAGAILSEDSQALALYFGSLGRAVLSLWQGISGGLDWDSICWPLFTEISSLTGFAFTAFIAFALLALMNVVTGVFVQTALLSARDEEDTFMQSQIIVLFSIADKDESATISWDEIEESLDDPSTSKEWKSIGVQAEDARSLFKLLDVERKDEVAFEDFMGGCLRLNGPAKAFDLLTVMQEQRKNDEASTRRFAGLSAAVIDVHETVRKTDDDIKALSEDLQWVVEKHEGDFKAIMGAMHSEFNRIREGMLPLKILEDMASFSPSSGIVHADTGATSTLV